jgi:hypothetical protein
MVKRKPPYVLISLVVLLLGGVFLINLGSRPKEEADAAPKPPPEATGAPKANEDASKIKDQMSSALSKVKDAGPKMKHGMAGGPPGSDPLIVKKQEPYKPKMSESAVSTRWWDDESAQKAKASSSQ